MQDPKAVMAALKAAPEHPAIPEEITDAETKARGGPGEKIPAGHSGEGIREEKRQEAGVIGLSAPQEHHRPGY